MAKEENIKEAMNIIKDVRRTMPECTNKSFLQGALNELDKALQFESENERLKAEVKQLKDFINKSCTYKPTP